MLKLLLAGASAVALASTAALADPAAQAEPAGPAGDAPQYMTEPAATEAAITPLEVTTRDDSQKLATVEFAVADANKDSVIDQAEFTAYAAMAAQANAVEPSKAAPADKAFAAIAKADKKISKQELAEARAKSFDAADANRDKLLDALEQQKFAALVIVKPAAANEPQ